MTVNAVKPGYHRFLHDNFKEKKDRIPCWLCVISIPLFSIANACYLIGTGAVDSRPNLSKWSQERHRIFISHLLPFPFSSRVWIRTVYNHLLRVIKYNVSKFLMIEDYLDL